MGWHYLCSRIVGSRLRVTAKFASEASGLAFEARFYQVAHDSWDVENKNVILLNADGVHERDLRSELQALGLEVFLGANSPEVGPSPVIVIEAEAWRCPRVRGQVEILRSVKPEAAVCVMTGRLAPDLHVNASTQPAFDDARTILQKAGFGFFTFGGVNNDHSVHS